MKLGWGWDRVLGRERRWGEGVGAMKWVGVMGIKWYQMK